MKTISVEKITEEVEKVCIYANYNLGSDVFSAFRKAYDNEESPVGKNVLSQLIENAEIAREEGMAICQDTGMAIFFVELGQNIRIEGGSLTDAINEGVRRGYKKGYLRYSVVSDPLKRVNTNDNTPAIIHYDVVEGDTLTITYGAKGFGSENMSSLKMLKPSDGVEGVKKFIIETVSNAGPNPCPPMIIGVGIGGTMEKASIMAKKAALRPVDVRSGDSDVGQLETELLEEINKLGIGPAGLGGRTTALAVNIETFATHIAGLPVAVNINCHAARHGVIKL
jgi:hydro-lyases, Fe-S type, tartrate/fumarate subfamily, alpha region